MSRELRLYEAVARWDVEGGPEVITAACQALIDGLDSPALRDLASASAHDDASDIRELVIETLQEIGVPYPSSPQPKFVLAAQRSTVDVLRLAVTPTDVSDFQLEVYVNDVEMTSEGAGLGMDPFDVLMPVNRLASDGRVPIARCDCGNYGCGVTDVAITREGGWVYWEWLVEKPMERVVVFAAEQYDAELARMDADHAWETPERAAARLVMTGVDREHLAAHGVELGWARNDFQNPERFQVFLTVGGRNTVLDVAWRGRRPDEVAREACAILARHPREWPARFTF
ncbi:hypothetical protein AB5J62_11010 [Amycolatopsis sp. cg5]|uniref:hypothetical protein n=1 Tax=Amycolatopsis sp. cg5 TaxID=3238802 RepID=UPI00352582CC